MTHYQNDAWTINQNTDADADEEMVDYEEDGLKDPDGENPEEDELMPSDVEDDA